MDRSGRNVYRRIRRGRHAAPTAIEKAAQRAGAAAPAVATLAVLAAGPQTGPIPQVSHNTQPVQTVQEPPSGALALGSVPDWLTHLPRNPGMQASAAKTAKTGDAVKAASPVAPHASPPAAPHTSPAAPASPAEPASPASSSATALSGTLDCAGLEQLWEDAGGSPLEATMAASIAMAESGGEQYALSPTDDRGYWQINAANGLLSTYDPMGNAKAAVELSDNGTNWEPWTTYQSGAYEGKC